MHVKFIFRFYLILQHYITLHDCIRENIVQGRFKEYTAAHHELSIPMMNKYMGIDLYYDIHNIIYV